MEREKHPCGSSAKLKKLRHTLVQKRFTRSKQGPQAAEKKISSPLTQSCRLSTSKSQRSVSWPPWLPLELRHRERETQQLSFHGRSDLSSPLSGHGLPPLHGWGRGLCDAVVAVRLLRVLAVLGLGAVLRVGLLPHRSVLFLLQLQVGAGEGVKDGRDGEGHEEDAAQDAAERHNLAGDASGHHVPVADRGHGDDRPPVAAGDACELLLGAHLALGQEHQRGEKSHGHAEEQQQQTELARTSPHRQAECLQA